jgi:DNA polymerase-3 subunit epsilon
MNMQKNSLIVFDLETTGVNTKTDRIVQICIMVDGVCKTRLVNPGITIPKEASDVHGITDEMVKDAPTFKQIAKSLFEVISGRDLCGFNSNHFDVPLLINEFARCGYDLDVSGVKLIDVSNIYRRLNPRSLEAAYKQYTGAELDGAHNAENDVKATWLLLEKIKEVHKEELHEKDLALYSNYDKKIVDLQGKFEETEKGIVFTFGKHKGELASSHPSFLRWMIEKGDFENDTIKIAKQILNK